MPRWPWRRPAPDTPDMEKAQRAVAPAATFTVDQVAALLNAGGRQVTGQMTPLPRTDPQVAFGPGVPLFPSAIDPVRPDTGRTEPRFNEYPVSANLPGVTDRLVPWKVLRDAAGVGGLPRRCIEIRKAEVATLDWDIVISQNAVETAQRENPDRARADIEADLRDRLGAEVSRCVAFWSKPDRGQGWTFGDWVSAVLEEHLVLDAVAIYPRYTRGGDLYSLEVVDGTTIKVLRDYRGGRPLPPQPAYQQMLWGFPRGEYVADADRDGQIANAWPADRLIYRRRNVRTFTPYGYSAVEQALADIDLWYRRRQWMGAEYTEGTVPQGLLETPIESMWTATQLKEYERDLNATYSGQTEERHRLRMLPPGLKLATNEDVAERYKPEYDLFLIKLVVAHFDTVVTELGFSEAKGLGSSGWHEGQTDVAERRGRGPTLRWLQAVLSDVSYNYLEMPPELEFKFLGLESEDEAAADQVAQNRIVNARMTLNEDRDRQGLPRYPFPEADMPVMMTPRGLVFMDGASKVEQPGVMLGPPDGTQPGQEAPGGAEKPGEPAPAQSAGGKQPTGEDGGTAVKAELAAYTRWRKKNPNPRRPFQFQLVTKADAPDLADNPDAILAEAGGVDPKAVEHPTSSRYWPGWGRDLETVAVWAPRIRRAMREAIDTRALAERWLAVRKADEPDTSAARLAGSATDAALTAAAAQETVVWLHSHGVDLNQAVRFVRDLWTEGYAIGHQAALEMLTGVAVDWSTWTPGDPQAARLVLDEDAGLEAMLNEADVAIRSIAGNRLSQLARVLAGALERGDSPATLARALRGVLDDPQWADMVATTELARGISWSTRETYIRNGIQMMTWLSAEDPRVCVECSDNEDAGPTPVNDIFPSGASIPPQHPDCRCCVTPVVVSPSEAGPAALATADTE